MRYILIIFLLLLAFPTLSATKVSSANEPKTAKITNITNITNITKATSFSQQLGLAAISIPEKISAQHENIISSSYNSNDEGLNANIIYNRSGHWLYQNNKDNIWLGRLISTNNNLSGRLNNESTSQFQGLNAAFNYGRFSIETALITENNNIKDSGKFYVQGAYTVLERSSFNIAVTAKVETLSEHNIGYYFGNKVQLEQSQSLIDYQAKNTTLGVVGTFVVTPQWTVIGAFTSTMLDKDIIQSPLVSDNNINTALIGTSYSF